MKSLPALVVLTMLCLGLSACGGGGKSTSSVSRASSQTTATVAATSSASRAQLEFKGDEDDDDESGEPPTGRTGDNDGDFDNDQKDKEGGYRDSDDSSVFAYGHAPSAAEERALTTLVKRYQAAAVASDGATACSMLIPKFHDSLPEDYGKAPGPAYTRGAKTCAAVMSRLFKHEHKRLIAPFQITGVRVGPSEALVALGSKQQPASYFDLNREGNTWKFVSLTWGPLP